MTDRAYRPPSSESDSELVVRIEYHYCMYYVIMLLNKTNLIELSKPLISREKLVTSWKVPILVNLNRKFESSEGLDK